MSPLTTQVQASLAEQEFTELWGKKAKELYGNTWNDFSDPQLRKIIGSIQTLGPSNLPLEEREQVGRHGSGAVKCLGGIFHEHPDSAADLLHFGGCHWPLHRD